MSNGFFSTTQPIHVTLCIRSKTQTASCNRTLRIPQLSMFTMRKDLCLQPCEKMNRSPTPTHKWTRWMQLSAGLYTSHSHKRILLWKEHIVHWGQNVLT